MSVPFLSVYIVHVHVHPLVYLQVHIHMHYLVYKYKAAGLFCQAFLRIILLELIIRHWMWVTGVTGVT